MKLETFAIPTILDDRPAQGDLADTEIFRGPVLSLVHADAG